MHLDKKNRARNKDLNVSVKGKNGEVTKNTNNFSFSFSPVGDDEQWF